MFLKGTSCLCLSFKHYKRQIPWFCSSRQEELICIDIKWSKKTQKLPSYTRRCHALISKAPTLASTGSDSWRNKDPPRNHPKDKRDWINKSPISQGFFITAWFGRLKKNCTPGNWHGTLNITQLKRKSIFQASISGFHVNFPGCKDREISWKLQTCMKSRPFNLNPDSCGNGPNRDVPLGWSSNTCVSARILKSKKSYV